MLQFKSELPPPRYALDGDLADSEYGVQTTREISFDAAPDVQTLVLVAHRCAPAVAGLLAAPAFHVRMTVATRSDAAVAGIDDFYEAEADSAEYERRQTFEAAGFCGPKDLTFVQLPALAFADAAALGRRLIDALAPRALVLLAPGQSFMDAPVAYVQTAGGTPPAGLPRAAPPVLVQGTGAAAVARAQQRGVPALALVVAADGPCDYEVVPSAHIDALRRAACDVLGLRLPDAPRVERDMSLLYV